MFHNGIIIQKKDILHYTHEDDAVLIGPGMVRSELKITEREESAFEAVISMRDEAEYAHALTGFLLHTFASKRFVIDAGALQMMDARWLTRLSTPAIITPHQFEFERLFGISIHALSQVEKIEIVKQTARHYHCVIMLKAIADIISDGHDVFVVKGGNAGLTKGGSGDVLAGLTAALYTKNDPMTSCIVASWLLKKSSDELYKRSSFWYNTSELICEIPAIFKRVQYNQTI